jgi:hypothetical protein
VGGDQPAAGVDEGEKVGKGYWVYMGRAFLKVYLGRIWKCTMLLYMIQSS